MADAGRAALRLLALALLAACTIATPSPTVTPTPEDTPRATPSPASAVPLASGAAPAAALPEPGRPFDAATVLEAMRTSPRPDGVPDQLETDAIAAAVADQLWTWAGQPWEELVAGGSCGPDSCLLEVSGAPETAAGEDLYVFTITPSAGAVELTETSLRGISLILVSDLDALARAVHPALNELSLLSARWRLPPDHGTFELSYRSGGEEFSCGVDLVLDATAGSVLSEAPQNC